MNLKTNPRPPRILREICGANKVVRALGVMPIAEQLGITRGDYPVLEGDSCRCLGIYHSPCYVPRRD